MRTGHLNGLYSGWLSNRWVFDNRLGAFNPQAIIKGFGWR